MKQARINKKSVHAEIIVRRSEDARLDMQQCGEEEEDQQTDSERSDREEKSQEETIYRVDAVEFLPPLSPNSIHCPSNKITIDNNNTITSNSKSPIGFNTETEIIAEKANTNIRRTSSSQSLEYNHSYDGESKQETATSSMKFGRKMLNVSVDSCREKLLQQNYQISSASSPTSSKSNIQGRPNVSRNSTAIKVRRVSEQHSSSKTTNENI
jgi:hypothetical protein